MRIIFFLLFIWSANLNAQESSMIYLENDEYKVGILTPVGGRIVYLQYKDSGNILKSDSTLWDEPDSLRVQPGPESPFKAYNGHIVWVGPQSEWWRHQDINPAKKTRSTNWPPDPWLIYGDYKVVSQTDNELVIMGPRSPVSGLRLVKTIRLESDGGIYFEAEAYNTRRTSVSWDLWLNTRLDGFVRSFVPVDQQEKVRIQDKESSRMPYAHCKGYFYYLTESPGSEQKQRNSKAFITPSQNWMAAFTGEYCFRISFPDSDPSKVHPEQAKVEIYNASFHNETENLTELEYHCDFKTLQPGESMKTWQRWEVLHYKGKDKPESYIRFMKRQFGE